MTGVHDHGTANERETRIAFRVEGLDKKMEANTSFLFLLLLFLLFVLLSLLVLLLGLHCVYCV